MSKKMRRLLFFFSLALFGILGSSLTLLSLGYNFDWPSYRWVKTGSFSLKTNLEAKIFVDRRFAGQTGAFFRVFAAKNLFPGFWPVEAKSAERQDWKKEIEIKEGLVVDFPQVFLWPTTLVWEQLAEGATNLTVSPHGRKVALARKGEVLFVDLNRREIDFRFSSPATTKFLPPLVWSADGQYVLVGRSPFSFLINLFTREKQEMVLPISLIHPRAVLSESALYSRQWLTGNLQRLDLEKQTTTFLPFAVSSWYGEEKEIWGITTGQPRLFRWKPQEGKTTLEFFDDLILSGNPELKIVEKVDDFRWLLIEDQLYQFDGREFKRLFLPVKEIAVSPSGRLLAWIAADNQLWTMGIKENLYQPLRRPGEKRLILNSDQLLSQLNWSGDGYLILRQGDEIVAVEEDERGGQNLNVLWRLTGKQEDFFGYFPEKNLLWLLTRGKLLVSSLN